MRLCCIFNYNPQYSLLVYSAMNKEFDCDSFFGGDTVFQPLKQFNPNELRGSQKYVNAKNAI